MKFYFNPVNPACKSVIGGIREGEELQLNLFLLSSDSAKDSGRAETDDFSFGAPDEALCASPSENAFLRLGKDGEEKERFPMQKTPFGWSISFSVGETGLYYYDFAIENVEGGRIVSGARGRGEYTSENRSSDFLLTVSKKDYRTPEWFKGGVMYQIFPDRFCHAGGEPPEIAGRILRKDWGGLPSYRPNEKGKVLNNDFFGGNFKGIESKLDYLKSLHVTVVYLNPIFHAASNHRYDTSDYMTADPLLGTNDDFKNLVEAAKNKGIRIILDGVFNHTGDNSVYFNKYGTFPTVGAYQSKDSPYHSWYSFQEFPDKYSSWWGIDILPEVNENSEAYQEFIFGQNGVLKTWLAHGIGGYRLDVADELPDFFLKKLRRSVKESDPNAIIIGEVWEDASDKIAYSARREYLQGEELDSVMNYPLKDAIIEFILSGNARIVADRINLLRDHYPKETLDSLMNILDTHDTARILTVFGGKQCYNKDEMASPALILTGEEEQRAIERLKAAALLQFTLPGVPCIYYGDENAMQGYIDPFCRKCFDWEHTNGALLGYYQKLGEIRERYKEIFKQGEYAEIFVKNGCILYKRTGETGTIYVFVNQSSEEYAVNAAGTYLNLLTDDENYDFTAIKPFSIGLLFHA